MKTLDEVHSRMEAELKHAIVRMTKDPRTKLYLYYAETTPESDGGFMFCAEKPASNNYMLAHPLPLQTNAEYYQLLNYWKPIVWKLPVMAYDHSI